MRRHFFVVVLLAAGTALFPQVAAAVDFVQALPDGRVVERNITSAEQVGFYFLPVPGRSYSVTVATLENFQISVGFALTPGGTCEDTDDPFVIRTESSEPIMSATVVQGARASFVAPNTGGFVACVTSTEAGVNTIAASVSDTTQFHPGWSTGGGFNTFYSIQNTTNGSCEVTLKLFDLGGAEVASTTQPIASGALLATNTSALGVAAGQAGTGTLTHLCPPGGILVDAAIANFGTSPAAIIPAKFAPVRE